MLLLFSVFMYLYTIVHSYLNSFFDVYNIIGLLISIILLGLSNTSSKSRIFLYLYTISILFLSNFNMNFAFLIGIAMLLGVYTKEYIQAILACLILLIVSSIQIIPILFLSGLLGQVMRLKNEIEDEYIKTSDDNRRKYYELEESKLILEKAQLDIILNTEVNERNRIARSVHDNIGHKLVGTKMILEAAVAIRAENEQKSDELTQRAVKELSESVDLLRDTVYDLKPNKEVGINNIKHIIKNFRFCQTEFKAQGDLNNISSGLFAVIERNLKEALTNISKYSNATLVSVIIENTDKYTRFIISDNGSSVSAGFISEGLGVSGMRNRVENIGGTFTIDCDNGFKLYTFFPVRRR